jgi:hypothetical protein
MLLPTLNGISLPHKPEVQAKELCAKVNGHLKNLRLRFWLVKICNKSLCAPAQGCKTVADAPGSERYFLPYKPELQAKELCVNGKWAFEEPSLALLACKDMQ